MPVMSIMCSVAFPIGSLGTSFPQPGLGPEGRAPPLVPAVPVAPAVPEPPLVPPLAPAVPLADVPAVPPPVPEVPLADEPAAPPAAPAAPAAESPAVPLGLLPSPAAPLAVSPACPLPEPAAPLDDEPPAPDPPDVLPAVPAVPWSGVLDPPQPTSERPPTPAANKNKMLPDVNLAVTRCCMGDTSGRLESRTRSCTSIGADAHEPAGTDGGSRSRSKCRWDLEGGRRTMVPAVLVVVSVIIVGALIWRASGGAPSEDAARPRTRSMIQRERRRGSRVVPPSDKPAELQIMGADFLEIPEVRDISENGLAISVPHRFNGHKPTSEVDLLLTLHGQGTVKAKGAIRHVSYTRNDTATFGVELVAIEDQDRDKIRRYLAKVEEGAPEPVAEAAEQEPVVHLAPARSRK
jgi:hypothetical protein